MGENKRRNDICTQLVRLSERMDADNAKLRQVTELAVQARSFTAAMPPHWQPPYDRAAQGWPTCRQVRTSRCLLQGPNQPVHYSRAAREWQEFDAFSSTLPEMTPFFLHVLPGLPQFVHDIVHTDCALRGRAGGGGGAVDALVAS